MIDSSGSPNVPPFQPPVDVTTPAPGNPDVVALRRQLQQLTAEVAALQVRLVASEEGRIRAEVEARRQSLTDELTGLLTRRGFLMQADLAWKIARRSSMRCALMFADLDGLSVINATRGRSAGDRVLQNAARVLRQTLRDADVVARVGDDEFAIFGLTGEGTAAMLITRLHDAVARFNQDEKPDVPLALSVGAVDLQWSGSVTLETLLAEAERGMMRGKRRRKEAKS